MGPSGSGKSTLMNIIGCLDSPTDGTYYLNNQEVSTLEGDELAGIRNKEIGFVFQNFHLLARNSALDNVMLPLKYAGVEKADQLKRAKMLFLRLALNQEWIISHLNFQEGSNKELLLPERLVNNPSILICR